MNAIVDGFQLCHQVHIENLCEIKRIYLQEEFRLSQKVSLTFPKTLEGERSEEANEGKLS